MSSSNSMQPFEFLGQPPQNPEKSHQRQASNEHLPETLPYAAYDDEFDGGLSVITTSTNGASKSKQFVQGVYIALFAILGTLLRMLVAQVFGEYCKNPDSIGWLKASAPLCVTHGGATEQGGIIFADLPANLLGSFIMGFFQDGASLGLALPIAVAWLTPRDPVQSMPILLKGITTGFCGSLTTFSGWNSAMVVLLFGTGQNRTTHVFNAIFGYIIGMETAVGSFMAGKSLALKLHQIVNPVLAAEAEAMKARAEEGVYINTNLPDFERRYLPDLQMGKPGEKNYGEMLPLGRLDALENWRTSTKEARRVRHPQLDLLIRIETAVLTEGLSVPADTISLAKANGWDLSGLEDWAASNRTRANRLPSLSASTINISFEPESRIFQPAFALTIFGVVMGALLVLLIVLNGQESYTITNRTMVYSMMFAPGGALLRWKLSSLNGSAKAKGWEWYPLGTFIANFLGSIISIIAIGGEYDWDTKDSMYEVATFWGIGTIRAFKVGFAGSLTTVSTFVSEITGFMNKTDHAYPYIFTTIGACCAVASLCYGTLLLVRAE